MLYGGSGGHRKLQRWLNELPEEILFSKPSVSIYQARFQSNSGQLEAAERTLKAVEQALDASNDRALQPSRESRSRLHILIRSNCEAG